MHLKTILCAFHPIFLGILNTIFEGFVMHLSFLVVTLIKCIQSLALIISIMLLYRLKAAYNTCADRTLRELLANR